MSIFNWFKTKEENSTPTKQSRRTAVTRDFTDALQCNSALTKGLYHNTYPGLKLAGGLAFSPIAIPVYFMGYPVVTQETLQDQIDDLIQTKINDMQQIHTQDHREGTIWIYPKLVKGVLYWEQIPDDTVVDIIRSLDTGEVIAVITDEMMKVTIGFNSAANVKRHRVYTKTKVIVTYEGDSVPAGLKDRTTRNPAGILPIPFSNNADGDEVRGHSDYERPLPDFKNYHDIELARSEMLAKFKVKMLQPVKDVDAWLSQNGYDSIDGIDIQTIDLIFNLEDQKTTYVFPSEANQTYKDTLSQIFKKIVEASGIPEIAWGLKTEGNMASVEENMSILLKYVADKQRQKIEQYTSLYNSSLRLMGYQNADVEVSWNKTEGVSPKEKVEIFASWAKGVALLADKAVLTKKQLFAMWKAQYPETTEEEYDEFVAGLQDMAAFRGFVSSSYDEQLDAAGETKE